MAKGKWGQSYLSHASDGDSCCVQAFVKSVGLPVGRTKPPVLVKEQRPSDMVLNRLLSEVEASASFAVQEQGGFMVGTEGMMIEPPSGATDQKGQSIDQRDRREGCKPLMKGGDCQPQRALDSNGTERPIFYRAAWKKSNGPNTFVWKITSR